jgi:carbohydrate kinase (thermoresistant glucokinase family)
MVILVMGVSGSGKTTVGRLLAERIGATFIEGDTHHPAANIAKMERGEPLTDADRLPWLEALRALIENLMERGETGVVACSALKARYREQLRVDHPRVHLVYLDGDAATIRARMDARTDHFMPPELLQSQFDALEPPAEADVIVSIGQTPGEIVQVICDRLNLHLEA